MIGIRVYKNDGQYIEVNSTDKAIVTIWIGDTDENRDPAAIVIDKEEWLEICQLIAKELESKYG